MTGLEVRNLEKTHKKAFSVQSITPKSPIVSTKNARNGLKKLEVQILVSVYAGFTAKIVVQKKVKIAGKKPIKKKHFRILNKKIAFLPH